MTATEQRPKMKDQPLEDVQEDARVRQFLSVYLDPKDFHFEPGVLLSELDLHSALRAQVRPTAGADGTVPDVVETYTLMGQKDGTYAPAGIAHALPNGRKELLDARQRVEAARNLGLTRMPFFVVTSDDQEKLWRIALRANPELNGLPPSPEDIDEQIRAYKRTFPGDSNVAIAILFKKSDHYVSRVLKRDQIGKTLEDMGFKTAAAHPADPEAAVFTPNIVTKLSPIADNTPVLKATAQLVKDAKASNPLTAELIKDLGEATSEADKLALVGAYREKWARRIKKAEAGVLPADLPTRDYPIRERLTRRAELLARDLSRYTNAAEAQMTDAKAANDFWGYVVSIEMAARRIVGLQAKHIK